MYPLYKYRLLVACLLCSVAVASAQQTQTAATLTAVPKLVHFAGSFHPPANQPAGPVGATFAIYSEQEGGTPLWTEDQNVELDANGSYTVMLGATKNAGVPPELFAGGEARWLQVKFYVPGEVDLPRVLLVSVPYALKAGDADTLGGKPASAYLLAGSAAAAQLEGPSGATQPAQPATSVPVKTAGVRPFFTTSGTTNYISKFTDASGDVGNSGLYQNGGNIGLGTTAAAIPFDIRPTPGSSYAQLGVAQTVDYMTLFASDKYGPAFYWEPTKALRFGKGGTGLYNATSFTEFMRIQPNGYVGIGTQTPAAALEVNGNAQVDGNLNLSGSILLTGVGPLIQVNSAPGNFSAGLGAGLPTSQDGTQDTAIGNNALAADSTGFQNTAVGFEAMLYNTVGYVNTATGALSLYRNTYGAGNTASGYQALFSNTYGNNNTGSGLSALISNTTGNNNTASGVSALFWNATGDYNTASGSQALYFDAAGGNNTASGYQALYNTTAGNNIGVGFQAGFNITTGSNNIEIGNQGLAADSGTIRLGTVGTQTSSYIAGIAGVTLPTANEPLVCIDPPTGQLGTLNCAPHGAPAAQQTVIDQQQRQIQAQAQQIADLQQRLSRLEALIASK